MLEQILLELALLFALCVGVAVAFHRVRMPPLAGFLVTGAVVGPHAIGLVHHEEIVRNLADVGVVVLLFAVGLEVPFGQLARLRRLVAVGGSLQLLGTVAVAAVAARAVGLAWPQAVFLGMLASLSSTAVVTKVLVDHGEFASPHGRLAMAISMAQDLAVVPMVLLLPFLTGQGESSGGAVLTTLQNLGILAAVVGAARWSLPHLLAVVGRTRNRELFVLTLATICLSLAVVTAQLGLSMALGALLAGMLLADTEWRSQAHAGVEPFRDALSALFFVSIGMLFDWRAVVELPGLVLTVLLAVLAGKSAVVLVAARVLGQPFAVRVLAALALAQVGEFSFVLAQVARGTAALPAAAERVFLVVAVASIALTPLLFGIGRWLLHRDRPAAEGAAGNAAAAPGHAVVVGCGPTGRAVAQSLRALSIPTVVVDADARVVRAARATGLEVAFGDATRAAVLRAQGIERAALLVLAIPDLAAATRIARMARQLSPALHVLARSMYVAEVESMRSAGAHEVVPQELETSVEMMVRALRRFLVPDDAIGRQVRELRARAGGIAKAAPVANWSPVTAATAEDGNRGPAGADCVPAGSAAAPPCVPTTPS